MPDLIAPSDEELTAAEVAAITGTPKPARQAAELALMNEAHCHRQALDVNVI